MRHCRILPLVTEKDHEDSGLSVYRSSFGTGTVVERGVVVAWGSVLWDCDGLPGLERGSLLTVLCSF